MVRQVIRSLVIGVLVSGFLLVGVVAAEQPRAGASPSARRAADDMRRNWLRKQLPRLISDPAELSRALAQLDELSAEQVNDLANSCLQELESRRGRSLTQLQEANRRERAFRAEVSRALAARAGAVPPVGYFPVITWLPDGVSMSAQAVVSPDGRSVRMSLMPFFSTIGPVHTFNFLTGETRRLPEFDPPSPGNLPPATSSPTTRPNSPYRGER